MVRKNLSTKLSTFYKVSVSVEKVQVRHIEKHTFSVLFLNQYSSWGGKKGLNFIVFHFSSLLGLMFVFGKSV